MTDPELPYDQWDVCQECGHKYPIHKDPGGRCQSWDTVVDPDDGWVQEQCDCEEFE